MIALSHLALLVWHQKEMSTVSMHQLPLKTVIFGLFSQRKLSRSDATRSRPAMFHYWSPKSTMANWNSFDLIQSSRTDLRNNILEFAGPWVSANRQNWPLDNLTWDIWTFSIYVAVLPLTLSFKPLILLLHCITQLEHYYIPTMQATVVPSSIKVHCFYVWDRTVMLALLYKA